MRHNYGRVYHPGAGALKNPFNPSMHDFVIVYFKDILIFLQNETKNLEHLIRP